MTFSDNLRLRKTLQNGLTNSPEVPYSREQIAAAIEQMHLPPAVRGETLTLEQFAQLANVLSEIPGIPPLHACIQ